MVAEELVRREDKEGNAAADAAADFGGLQHLEVVIGARRNLLRVEREWYLGMLVLYRFIFAIAREALNHGDGTKGLRQKSRKLIPSSYMTWLVCLIHLVSKTLIGLRSILALRETRVNSLIRSPSRLKLLPFFLPFVGQKG